MGKPIIEPLKDRVDLRAASHLFGDLQRQMDHLFDDFRRNFDRRADAVLAPAVDLSETETEIEITVELPGLTQADVDVHLDGDMLRISGEKRTAKEEQGRNYRLVERSRGAFSRSIGLPRGVEPESVQASMTDGVLKISVAKPVGTEPKRIEIATA